MAKLSTFTKNVVCKAEHKSYQKSTRAEYKSKLLLQQFMNKITACNIYGTNFPPPPHTIRKDRK